MSWLRSILLLAGVVFIGLLIWWERRSRQAHQAQESAAARGERSEPSFDMSAEAHTEPTGEAVRREREREVRRAPPVIDWSDTPVAAGDKPPLRVLAVEESPAAAAADALGGAAPVALNLAPLIVDWPAENERRIVTLRIVPMREDRLGGRALRQGLAACGFRHGQFGIFHLPQDDGRVVLSAASLVRPGMLDPATMDFQRFSGINVFAVLPGPLSAARALERLGRVAADLAARVEGRVQDDSGAPFNAAAAVGWRQRCLISLGATGAAAGPAG